MKLGEKIIRVLGALALITLSVFTMSAGGGFGPWFSLIFAVPAGLIIAPVISAPFEKMVANLFFPGNSGAPLPEEFSRARAMITEHDYNGAVKQLKEQLAANPELILGRILLAEVLYEKLERPDDALQVLSALPFSRTWQPETERLLFLVCDILEEQRRTREAKTLLQQHLPRCKDKRIAVKLEQRLNLLSQIF